MGAVGMRDTNVVGAKGAGTAGPNGSNRMDCASGKGANRMKGIAKGMRKTGTNRTKGFANGTGGAGMNGTPGFHMKGQYFSFDAVIATVIMVLATTSLLAYWYGAQSVVDSRTGSMYADSLRIAGSLLSPGSPSNWAGQPDLSAVKQIGLSDGFSNQLNRSKIERLNETVGVFYSSSPPASESNYTKVGRILRSPGEYYIVIERTDGNGTPGPYAIGYSYPANAREVAIAHRGATIDGIPVRLRVFLWRQ